MSKQVSLTEVDDHQGQASYRIATAAATYVLHRQGAGLASLIDPDGADWLSYRPGNGSAGEYRGFPNVIHPDGGFHAGNKSCSTTVRSQSDDRVVIDAAKGDAWTAAYAFTPSRLDLTITRIGHPYWVLYEGTPGGKYDQDQAYMVDSAGKHRPCSDRWELRLPDPRWIYFATPASKYVLYLVDRTKRKPDVVDSYWSMQRNMTVFGFGRTLRNGDRWMHLTEVPAVVTIGLLEAAEHDVLAEQLNGIAAG